VPYRPYPLSTPYSSLAALSIVRATDDRLIACVLQLSMRAPAEGSVEHTRATKERTTHGSHTVHAPPRHPCTLGFSLTVAAL
jgi:hypothetical protein